MKRCDRSQIVFQFGRRWKPFTRPGYVPTGAARLLVQPCLLLLWLAIATFPAWTQTGASQSTPDPCTSGHEFATTDCTLTWHGITLYGAYDVGFGWVSVPPSSDPQ